MWHDLIVIGGHIVPLVWTGGSLDTYYSVAHINIKSSGFVVNISQDDFAVSVERCGVKPAPPLAQLHKVLVLVLFSQNEVSFALPMTKLT